MKSLICLFIITATASFASTKIHYPRCTGREYYIIFPQSAYGNANVGVLINSPTAQTVSIVESSGRIDNVQITKAKSTRYVGSGFRVDSIPEIMHMNEATYIHSPDPTTIVAQYGVDGISGTYAPLPVTSWGTEYYAVAPPEGANSSYYLYPQVYSVPIITIIAATKNTVVTITPTALTARGHLPMVPFTVTLNAGDVYTVTTAGDPRGTMLQENECVADLSGTHVTATNPIGVIVAQSYTSWPCGSNDFGDYGVEWLPPVINWDSVYLITPAVPRITGQGEHIRLVFASDSTNVKIDDPTEGIYSLGIFNAGQYVDVANPIVNPLIVSANNPFLILDMTTRLDTSPALAFSMVIPTGVHQFSDYTPYTSPAGAQSVADLCFRYSDVKNIKLNGVPLLQQFPTLMLLQEGFVWLTISMNGGVYAEVTSDSGAGCGGMIFGFGTTTYTPSDSLDRDRVQAPKLIKSFAHAVGMNAVPISSLDITPPKFSVAPTCRHWSVTASENFIDRYETGIYDIWLGMSSSADTSYNVVYSPAPKYKYGDLSTTYGIDIVDSMKPAQAALHVRDGAGNEFDTVITYEPFPIIADPAAQDIGEIRIGDTVDVQVTLLNPTDDSVRVNGYRLRFGTHWRIDLLHAPVAPFTIPARGRTSVRLKYAAPIVQFHETDVDTLLVTTCAEYPVCALQGATLRATISTACYDFGSLRVDTLPLYGGDTVSCGNGVYVTNIGGDTLHITGLDLYGKVTPGDSTFPKSDYSFGLFLKSDLQGRVESLGFPQPTWPWSIANQETLYVEVLAHPHHTGPRGAGMPNTSPANYAYIYFDNDGESDKYAAACLTMIGVPDGVVATNIDYGKHLYATTQDSFITILNTNNVIDTIVKDAFRSKSFSNNKLFVLQSYYDATSSTTISYDSSASYTLSAGDSVRVPYRFIASALGEREDSISITTTSAKEIISTLKGNVLEPRIHAVSA